jgi:putative PEP-CTERM system TPR-repeat lipoprotein
MALIAGPQPAFAGPKQEDAAGYYEDALARFKRDDAAGAIVQLNNALQQDPGMLAARVLLGKAYLRQRDLVSAEQELSKALAMGVDRSEVIVPLALALQGQGKHKEVLERYSPEGLPVAQQVELLLVRGESFRTLDDTKSALRAFQDAAVLDPGNVPALLAQADLLAAQGKRAEANSFLDRALSLTPDSAYAWRVKAGILLTGGDNQAALAAYSKAIALDPHSAEARVGRASLLIGLGRDSEAATDIEQLRRESPREPRGIYLRAVLLGRKGDDAGARAALQQVAEAIDPVPRPLLKHQASPLLMIGGLAHYSLGEAEKARSYFQDYVTVVPNNAAARKLLGSILLSRGDIVGAISTLELAQRLAPSDPQVLSLLAVAHMAQGEYRVANRFLEQALQSASGDPDVHATLGFSLLGIGQRDLALGHLRQAFAKDPTQYRVGAALALLYLRQGQPKEAVTVAEAVAQRGPSNPFVLNLLGVAKAAAGDRAGARAAYLKTIEADQAFVSAELNLAKLDDLDGNHAAARERFLTVLKSRPKDVQVMYGLAQIEVNSGRPAEAVRWLQKAHELNRRDSRVTLQLVQLQVASRNADAALVAARETQAALPDNLDALAALGIAYAALGNAVRARTTFNRMEVLASSDSEWQTRIANYQASIGNLQAAQRCLGKALTAQPDYMPAQIRLTEVEVQTGQLAQAEQRARAIASRYPDWALGRRLLADVAMGKKNYPEAIAGYRAALTMEPSTEGAIRLSNAYVQMGNPAQAVEQLESWVRARPDDVVAMHALAEGSLRAGNLNSARSWYEQVLKVAGAQPSVLNNLANVLAKQGDPKALSYAEQAYAAAPNDAAVLDTLGWVLVQQGQLRGGLRYLREARLRNPKSHEIRYHLAVVLSRTGHPDEARAELEPAIADRSTFDGSGDAHHLWQQLSSR